MVKEHLGLKNELVNGKRPCRRADETHLKETETGRERDLTEMEAEGGGNVQVRVNVVDIVKAPEKWHSMISQVPVVEREIHQQKAKHEDNRRRQRNEMNKSKRLARRPSQRRLHRRLEQADRRHEGQYRNCEVHARVARGVIAWLCADGKKTLSDEQQRKNCNSDERLSEDFSSRKI